MSAEQPPDIADVLAEYLCPRGHGDGWFSMTTDAEGTTKSESEHRWPCGQHHVQADILAAALAPVLAAAVREAEQRGYLVAVGTFHEAHPDHCGGECFRYSDVNHALDRADRITEPVSHEAATSGEEASKA